MTLLELLETEAAELEARAKASSRDDHGAHWKARATRLREAAARLREEWARQHKQYPDGSFVPCGFAVTAALTRINGGPLK